MESIYSRRMRRLGEELIKNSLRGAIIPPGANLRYYTGGHSLLLERPFFMIVPAEGVAHLVSPTLESGPYIRSPVNITIHKWSDSDGPAGAIREAVGAVELTGKWGIEGSTPYRFLDQLTRFVQPQFENADSILQGIRAVKDVQEAKLLSQAAAILSKSFQNVPNMIKVGRSEVEMAQAISGEIQSNGAETVPDVLVQTGPMAADGHHLSSSRKLKRKESIVVDATCTHSGYYADITRTFFLGRDAAFESLYDSLLAAQTAAIKAAGPGVVVADVDSAARTSLRDQHLDGYFVHRTGHGLGLEVHEAPYITSNGTQILQPSMAFTIEPGIYFAGKTGLRIEDNLMTTEETCKVLTKQVPKEYGWWN